MQKPAKVHHRLLVSWLQGQREEGNRLADAKSIQGGVRPTVTPAHQDTIIARTAVAHDRHGLPGAHKVNLDEVSPGRQHIQTLVLIHPAPTPWTLVGGGKDL